MFLVPWFKKLSTFSKCLVVLLAMGGIQTLVNAVQLATGQSTAQPMTCETGEWARETQVFIQIMGRFESGCKSVVVRWRSGVNSTHYPDGRVTYAPRR